MLKPVYLNLALIHTSRLRLKTIQLAPISIEIGLSDITRASLIYCIEDELNA